MKEFKNLSAVVNHLMLDNTITNCAVSIGNANGELYRLMYDDGNLKTTNSTLFDLASVSKIVGVTMVILQLIDQGKVKITDTMGDYFDCGNEKKEITIQQLLTHTSGMTSNIDGELTNEKVLTSIFETPLSYKPGEAVCYSCPGFITLGKIIEAVTAESFDIAVHKYVFEPIGMKSSCYNPKGANIAPGLKERPYIASDFRAHAMGGVAGNAGIFSDIDDMSRFGTMLSNKAKGLVSSGTFNLATKGYTECLTDFTTNLKAETRGLGFNIVDENFYQANSLFSPMSYGHTGWTGTSVFADAKTGIYVVNLSNRHAGDYNDERIPRLYRQLMHMAIAKDLGL